MYHLHVNPVIFDDVPDDENLTIFSATLNEWAWKNRIVGLTSSGFLVVHKKVARQGYYDFYPRLLEWERIREVRIGRHVAWVSATLGILGILFFCAVTQHLTWQTLPNLYGFIFLLACGFGGVCFVIGALRNRIIVYTADTKYHWTCDPLDVLRTRPLCYHAAYESSLNGVLTRSRFVLEENSVTLLDDRDFFPE